LRIDCENDVRCGCGRLIARTSGLDIEFKCSRCKNVLLYRVDVAGRCLVPVSATACCCVSCTCDGGAPAAARR
jgi:hypothetical protein